MAGVGVPEARLDGFREEVTVLCRAWKRVGGLRQVCRTPTPNLHRLEHWLAKHRPRRPDCLCLTGPGSACAIWWQTSLQPSTRPSCGLPQEEGLRDDFKDAKEGSVLPGPQLNVARMMAALGSQRRLLGSLNCTPPATLPLTLSPNRTGPQCLEVSIPNGLFLSLGLVSLVENVLVVAAIAKNRNLHSPMYYFICCLAVSDLLVSVSNVLETVVMLLLEAGALAPRAAVVQQLDNVIDVLICSSMVSSLCFLGAIAVDRYISIFYALRYHSIVTLSRAWRIIAAIWVASILSSMLFITYYNHTVVLLCLIGFFIAMLALMAILYIHMLARACQHARGIARLQKRQRPIHQGFGFKGAATLTILLGVFFLCWGPFFLHLLLIVLCPQHPTCGCIFKNFNLFLALIICNAIVDPLIYAFRSQELRKTLQEVLQCSW